MGYIAAIRSYDNSTALYAFNPIAIAQQKDVERKSGTYAVIGADGGVDPYGLNAAPLVIQQQKYTFRAFFGQAFTYKSFDAAYDALAKLVMPGLPHTLIYQDDAGNQWQRQARPLAMKHTVTPNTYRYADFEVTWELQGSSWRAFSPSGSDRAWGAAGLLWGAASGTWGTTTSPLNATTVAFTADMTTATAPDLAPLFTVWGAWGTTTPATGWTASWYIQNNSITVPSPQGPLPMILYILDTLGASDSYTIDVGQMAVTKNGVPAYANLSIPSWQQQWMRLDPGIVNNLQIGVAPGTGQSTAGRLRFDYFVRKY